MLEVNDFDPYEPVAYHGESFSFHESEKKIIDDLRKWASEYFKDFQIYDSETQIPIRSQNHDGMFYYRDFDIQGKVIKFEKLNKNFNQFLI